MVVKIKQTLQRELLPAEKQKKAIADAVEYYLALPKEVKISIYSEGTKKLGFNYFNPHNLADLKTDRNDPVHLELAWQHIPSRNAFLSMLEKKQMRMCLVNRGAFKVYKDKDTWMLAPTPQHLLEGSKLKRDQE